MSRNKRFLLNIVIVVLVIGLLGGGIYVLTRQEEAGSLGEISTDDDKYKIFSYSVDELWAARVTNKYGSYSLSRKGSSWEIDGFEGVGINASMLDNLVYDFQNVRSQSRIEEDARDLSVYGLSEPSAALTLVLSDSEKTFFIGDKTPDGAGYYFRTDTSLDVYVMDSYMVDVINLTARDYADIGSSFSADEVTGVCIIGENGSVLNVKRQAQGQKDQYGLLSYWDIIEPNLQSASNSDVVSLITSPVADMENSASAILSDTSENLALTGMNAPEYTVSVTTEKEIINYEISHANGEYRYIHNQNSNLILRVDSEACDFAALRPYDVAEKYLALVEIGMVRAVNIEHGGRRTELSVIDGKGENAAFYADGNEVDGETFRTFYSHIVALDVSGEAVNPKYQDIIGSIEYKLISGETIKLEFALYDERNYAVFVNGSGLYCAAKKNIDKVFDEVRSTFK